MPESLYLSARPLSVTLLISFFLRDRIFSSNSDFSEILYLFFATRPGGGSVFIVPSSPLN